MTITNSGANRIAIIDNFKGKYVDVDGDKIPDISHGEAVENLFKTKQPNAEIIRYDVGSDTDASQVSTDKLASAYEDLSQRIEGGEKIDGVNMSVSTDTRIGFFNRFTKKPVTAENISKKEDEIKNSSGYDNMSQTTGRKNVLSNMEKVTSQGVPVYVAGGNNGPGYFNEYGLAKGVTQVGGTGLNGNIHPDSADNSDIKKYAQGEFEIKSIKDAAGKITGYDYTGDGKIDLSAEDASSKGASEPKGAKIFGTSFSSPLALSEDV